MRPDRRMLPPSAPAPGPMSTITSASRIVSSSCSMMISVLPRSRSVLQRRQQPVVVALMQPDRRFVQDVEHADERRADLRRQTDALRFAARERRRRTREIQIAEADVGQEAQPRADLFEDLVRDLRFALGWLEVAEELLGALDRHLRDVVDVLAADRDRQRFGLEPRAVADLAVSRPTCISRCLP